MNKDQTNIPISKIINQHYYNLIGYRVFYKNGSNEFFSIPEDINNIDHKEVSHIEQVGEKKRK